jgi:structural maintenance of chromosome 4
MSDAGFKTFRRETLIGPFDESFTAIVGPNGLGKTVIADAVRFTLGANFSSIRVQSAKEVINHSLVKELGNNAHCTTEVGFCVHVDSPISDGNHEARVVRIRRRVVASGHSTYSVQCQLQLPTGDSFLKDTLTTRSYVCFWHSAWLHVWY